MAPLSIRVMGGICLEKDGERFDDKLSLKALALVCLLLTSEGLRMRKGRIISLLWPDSDEEASRNNLRYNVWNLKKMLPLDDKGEGLVLSDKNTLYINSGYEFTADILKLREFESSRTYTEKELMAYRDLFKGEYLEGFYIKGCMEYSDMMLMERIACQNLQIVVLERLHSAYLAGENFSRCIETLKELLLIDPYNERFACLIMEHMLSLGQYAGSLAFYKKFTANIRQDLNLPPSPELLRLYKETTGGHSTGTYSEGWEKSGGAERQSKQVKKKDKAEGRGIYIEAVCLSGVENFFLAECLKQFAETVDADRFAAVSRSAIRDLAWLCPELLQKICSDSATDAESTANGEGAEDLENMLRWIPAAEIPQVRILNAFYDLLAALSKTEPVGIEVKFADELDPSSEKLLKLLEKKPIEGVVIYKE